jgi:hypothetical protein
MFSFLPSGIDDKLSPSRVETGKHTDERRTDNENDDMTFVSPLFSNPTGNSLTGKFMDFDKNLKTLALQYYQIIKIWLRL